MKRKGITLIELLIYLAITALVLVVVIDLVARIAQNQTAAAGQGEVNSNARFLVDRLTYSIQSAKDVPGSYPTDDLTLTVGALTETYALSSGQVFYQEGASPAVALTSSAVEITPQGVGQSLYTKVTNGSAQSVIIKLRVRYKQNNLTKDFETTVLAKGK